MLAIKLGDPGIVPPEQFARLFAAADGGLPELAVIVMLGNGFIITSMVWASFVVALIDQRHARAAAILLLGALLTAFGVIHSIEPSGSIYLPWLLGSSERFLVWQFTGAYLVLAAIVLALGLMRPAPCPADAESRAP
jgi:AGZA family xanthine/uracil permease-like MFS transporter